MTLRNHLRFKLVAGLAAAASVPWLLAVDSTTTQTITQTTFASPEQASQELLRVAKSGDKAAALQLFGPEGKDIIESGDPVQDRNNKETFLTNAGTYMKTEMDPMNRSRSVIIIGEDRHPFAIPIVRTNDGRWRFDTENGKAELLARRIGSNELEAIGTLEAYVAAQNEYSSNNYGGNRQYAARLMSTPGTRDGLFWPGEETSGTSPLAGKVEQARKEGYTKSAEGPTPYHGYYFRTLTGQGKNAASGKKDYMVGSDMTGGFALVAWPVNYGVSGIKTFVVNQDGTVYESDLGPDTARKADRITRFNPDKNWSALR